MKWIVVALAAFLLGGCSRASMPDLEDVPPTAQASVDAQAGDGPTGGLELTVEQRSDIERGVQRGLQDPNPATFGPMAATVSRNTSKSYIVCGWVQPADGNLTYQPFIAMYVPTMRIALLVGVGGRNPENEIRQRCSAEGVPLPS